MREAVNRRGEKVKEIMSVLREREREREREGERERKKTTARKRLYFFDFPFSKFFKENFRRRRPERNTSDTFTT